MKRFFIGASALSLSLAMFMGSAYAAQTMKIDTVVPATVGALEEQKGTLINVREEKADAWGEEQTFELKLSSGIKWNSKTLVNGRAAQIDGSSLKFKIKTDLKERDMFYVVPYFDIERGTKPGDLTVLVDVVGKNDSEVAKVATISDYAVNISSSYQRATENTKIPVEITITEAVENSMISGSPFDLVFDNADIVKDSVKIKNVKGEDTLTVRNQKGDYVSLDLNEKAATPNKWTINLDIMPKNGYKGDITATFEGKGFDTVKTVVANVVEGLSVAERKADVIELGKMDQKLSDIIISETQAGALQEGEYLLKLDPAYKGLQFGKDFKVEATRGDIRVGNEKLDGTTIGFSVRGESIKPSTITVSNLMVTLDKFGYDGSYKFNLVNAKMPDQTIKTIELFVVNPAPKQREVVFAIGGKDYTVDGKAMSLDSEPYISNGRTMLPVRALAEALDSKVDWDAVTRTATLKTKDNKIVTITLEQSSMTVDGKSVILDAPAEIKDGRTFLPMRAIAESLGAEVKWSASSKTATVIK